jgi:hypothetical protein
LTTGIFIVNLVLKLLEVKIMKKEEQDKRKALLAQIENGKNLRRRENTNTNDTRTGNSVVNAITARRQHLEDGPDHNHNAQSTSSSIEVHHIVDPNARVAAAHTPRTSHGIPSNGMFNANLADQVARSRSTSPSSNGSNDINESDWDDTSNTNDKNVAPSTAATTRKEPGKLDPYKTNKFERLLFPNNKRTQSESIGAANVTNPVPHAQNSNDNNTQAPVAGGRLNRNRINEFGELFQNRAQRQSAPANVTHPMPESHDSNVNNVTHQHNTQEPVAGGRLNRNRINEFGELFQNRAQRQSAPANVTHPMPESHDSNVNNVTHQHNTQEPVAGGRLNRNRINEFGELFQNRAQRQSAPANVTHPMPESHDSNVDNVTHHHNTQEPVADGRLNRNRINEFGELFQNRAQRQSAPANVTNPMPQVEANMPNLAQEQEATRIQAEQEMIRQEQAAEMIRQEQAAEMIRQEQAAEMIRQEQAAERRRQEQAAEIIRQAQAAEIIRQEQEDVRIQAEQARIAQAKADAEVVLRRQQQEAEARRQAPAETNPIINQLIQKGKPGLAKAAKKL